MSATYILTLRAANNDRDSIHSLRAVLKFAKRRGLRVTDAREVHQIDEHSARRAALDAHGENPTTRQKGATP
jgi:hypothetical protein